jgi:hypothetical protein
LKTRATANAGAAPTRHATFSRRPHPSRPIRLPNERTETCQITDTSQGKTTSAGAGPAARSHDRTGGGSRSRGPKARVSRTRGRLGGRAGRVGTKAAVDDDSRVLAEAGPQASPVPSVSASRDQEGRGRPGRDHLGTESPGHDPAVFGRTDPAPISKAGPPIATAVPLVAARGVSGSRGTSGPHVRLDRTVPPMAARGRDLARVGGHATRASAGARRASRLEMLVARGDPPGPRVQAVAPASAPGARVRVQAVAPASAPDLELGVPVRDSAVAVPRTLRRRPTPPRPAISTARPSCPKLKMSPPRPTQSPGQT